jgi:hypothetical protein
MKVYTYSRARNRLAEVLEESKRETVVIRRRRSPFDVPGVGKGIARRELLAAIRESRSGRGRRSHPEP